LRKNSIPAGGRQSYAANHGFVTNHVMSHGPPSSEDVRVVNVPRVTLIANGSPNNNHSSSEVSTRPRMSSSSSASDSTSCVTTPPHERRIFMSTAPRTNPRCVYSSPVPTQPCLASPLGGPLTDGSVTGVMLAATESTYGRRKSRKSSTVANSRGRVYDSSSSDCDSDYEPSIVRFRNAKRGSRNALDRVTNPKSLDEVTLTLLMELERRNLMKFCFVCSTRRKSWNSATPWSRCSRV